MADLPNGFTSLPNHDDDFESAAEASRKLQEALAAGRGLSSSQQQGGALVGASSGDSLFGESVFGSSVPEDPAFIRGASSNARRNGDARDASRSFVGIRTGGAAADARRAGGSTNAPAPFDFDKLAELSSDQRRWAWLEIDLSAIRYNVAETRRYLQPRTRLMAVVKADAYGHGAVQASKAMLGAGADRLAVATVPEGIELREAGITAPIAILEQPPTTSVPLLLAYNITPAIYEPSFAVAYGEAADLHGVVAPYHLAVNTGMNRVGVHYREAAEFLRQVSFHRGLELEGVFTHFATADSPEILELRTQVQRFMEAIDSIKAAGFDPGIVHAANSAATYRFPEVHFDMVRCGISLYGIHPCEDTRGRLDLRPAMGVRARIIDTRLVPVSEGVSYGYWYRSPGSVKICTLPLGYADGLRRGLSGKMDVIMNGNYYRQVGAICMDQCMFEVDLRNRRNLSFDPQVGDEVIIVGSQGAAEITMDELAEKLGTIPYEIVTGFSQRLEKVYR